MWQDYDHDRHDEVCDEMLRGGTSLIAVEGAGSALEQKKNSEVVSESFDYYTYSRSSNANDATRDEVDRVDKSLHSYEQNEIRLEKYGEPEFFHSFDQEEYPVQMDYAVFCQESAAAPSFQENARSRKFYVPNALPFPTTEMNDYDNSIATGVEIDIWQQSIEQRIHPANIDTWEECREIEIMDSSRICEQLSDTVIPAESFSHKFTGGPKFASSADKDADFGSQFLGLTGQRADAPS